MKTIYSLFLSLFRKHNLQTKFMKKNAISILIALICWTFILPTYGQDNTNAERKKVGVVLSGGGAKGVAHIGALKVIREVGIPIDYIAGTSMGSIVGGLSAIGYSPAQLDSMVKAQDWILLLSDKIKRSEQTMEERQNAETYILSVPLSKKLRRKAAGGMIQGVNLYNLFQELTVGYHDSINFNKLPIPFACVSENIVNGTKHVFHSGELPFAMRSSMAIPGVFTPMREDGMVFVDGGMIDNYPVDVCRAMGADIIIGIDVQNDLKTANELNSVTDVLFQIIDLTGQGIYERNIKATDLYVKVDVKGFSSASFTQAALDTLMIRGEEATMNKWDELVELKKSLNLSDDYMPDYPSFNLIGIDDRQIPINTISFTGIKDDDKKWLMRKCKLKEDAPFITKGQLENALSILRGTQAYSSVNYKLTQTGDERYNLDFLLEEKYEKNLNIGIRFDSEEIASLLLNATFNLKTKIPSKVAITGRLGQRYVARADYTIEPLQMRNFNFAYQFEYNDINVYDRGKKAYNTSYKHQLGEFSFSDVWFRNFRFAFGLRFDYYKYSNFLYNTPVFDLEIKPEHFFTYFANVHYNSYNAPYFPTKGSDFKVGYSLYTSNFAKYNGHSPFSAINASWATTISPTKRFTILPSIYGRVLIGDYIGYPFINFIGGNYFGRFVPQQMPFAGITKMEIMQNSVLIGAVKLRQRIGGNNYIHLTGNVVFSNNNFDDIFSDGCKFGVSAGYAYNSFFGPLEASIGYSNQSKKAAFYVNLGYYF